jgi:hypothetical protein
MPLSLDNPLRGTIKLDTTVTRSASCLNCHAALAGPFCSQCGQRDIPPYPSTRELVVDAFWELSGWDGRFASTVRALVQRPGMLTREFLAGRRARFLSPLRLYLLASLAYFLIAAATPAVHLSGSKSDLKVRASVNSRPNRVADAVTESLVDGQTLTGVKREQTLKDIERAPALMRPFLRTTVSDPNGFKRRVVEAMPRMLFALLPVFAAIVAIFYRRRKYPEHLYFAIHLHAFMFLALSLAAAAKFTQLSGVADAVRLAALLWIAVYATLAFRRVYGGSYAITLMKQAGIGLLYFTVAAFAFLVTVYLVSVAA